jgi:hypothetical protein
MPEIQQAQEEYAQRFFLRFWLRLLFFQTQQARFQAVDARRQSSGAEEQHSDGEQPQEDQPGRVDQPGLQRAQDRRG